MSCEKYEFPVVMVLAMFFEKVDVMALNMSLEGLMVHGKV
jgi:hypothetical protein